MKKLIISYILLLFGAFLQGLSMSFFLFPHSIPSGGAAGLALLVNHWFGFPLGLSLWLANAVFLVFAYQYFGSSWTFRTIIAVATTSTTISILASQVPFPHVHIILDILAGSLFFGIGVGILIRVGSSSGGMVIPALMIASYKNWSPGKVMMVINLMVFLLTSLVIDYKIVVFAVICQFLSTRVIDYIYELRIHRIALLSPYWRKK
ncbi:YitT family protein [Bacillus sp. FJAT-49732]|uniref:YitT family protein n=1 Tax=Lederbergia citrisecunda TaxID=2833583 RepID=A0A942TRH6_9BACI|nr:YitT family protein [Lederbergia citrisecunda]MBS4202405.1 YitT family protein [Lederbergia citrisecunda]